MLAGKEKKALLLLIKKKKKTSVRVWKGVIWKDDTCVFGVYLGSCCFGG